MVIQLLLYLKCNIYVQDEGKGDGEGDGEKRFDGSGYDKDLVEALERDILQKNPNVHWYEIIIKYNLQIHLIAITLSNKNDKKTKEKSQIGIN